MSEAVTSAAPSASPQATSSAPAQSTPSTGGQSQAQGGAQASNAQATPQGSEAAQAQAQAKRYLESDAEDAFVKLKNGDQEEEISLKDLKKRAQLEKLSRQKISEADKIRKQQEQFFKSLQENPEQTLEQVLKDRFDEIAEARLARKYELSQMDPVQRENLTLKQQIEQARQQELNSKKPILEQLRKLDSSLPADAENYPVEHLKQYLEHVQGIHQQQEHALHQEIISAYEGEGLPKSKTWAKWIAMEMRDHEIATGEPLQAKDAAVKVKKDWQKFNQTLFKDMDAQAIHDFLGKEVVQKLNEYTIQQATTQAPQGFQNQGPGTQSASKEKKQLNQFEWRKAVGLE